MKYILLVYADEKSWTDDEREHCYAESTQLCQDLASRGQYVAASPLQPVATATSVRVRSGKPVVTDGPFAEAKEVLGGYWMIDVESREQAIAWAGKCPASENEIIEIRQVQEMADFSEEVQQAAAGLAELQRGSSR